MERSLASSSGLVREIEILKPFHVPGENGETMRHGHRYKVSVQTAELLIDRGQAVYVEIEEDRA